MLTGCIDRLKTEIVRLSMDIRAGEYIEPGRYGETEVCARATLDPDRVLRPSGTCRSRTTRRA
jgi:hypothetical protein